MMPETSWDLAIRAFMDAGFDQGLADRYTHEIAEIAVTESPERALEQAERGLGDPDHPYADRIYEGIQHAVDVVGRNVGPHGDVPLPEYEAALAPSPEELREAYGDQIPEDPRQIMDDFDIVIPGEAEEDDAMFDHAFNEFTEELGHNADRARYEAGYRHGFEDASGL